MDCAGVAGHLVAYHVGTVSDAERDDVEAHLVECSACVKTYLALKRASDRGVWGRSGPSGDELLERPRSDVKARLRAEVARAFPNPSVSAASSRSSTFARRIPLYQGVALAAIAAAIALAAPNVLQRVSRDDRTTGAPAIDSSRTKAESLHIY